MSNILRKQTIVVDTIAGGVSGSTYGNTYGSRVVGEIRRIDVSGASCGSTGWWKLQESGAMISDTFIGGSEAVIGTMVWYGAYTPGLNIAQGNLVENSLGGGSSYGYYVSDSIPNLIVSGTQSGGQVTADIYWNESRTGQ